MCDDDTIIAHDDNMTDKEPTNEWAMNTDEVCTVLNGITVVVRGM